MQNRTEQVEAIVNKFDKAVENVVVMDFTKSQISPKGAQNVYQFPEEIGDMLLKLYKESLYHTSFDNIKRTLISDIRDTNNMVDLNKMLFEFMEKREFIDNVKNNTLDTYKTENFVEPTAEAVLPADLPHNVEANPDEKYYLAHKDDDNCPEDAPAKSKFSHLK